MNGNTCAKIADFSQNHYFYCTNSLRFGDTPLKVGYLHMFSVIKGLSPTRKSEKRVFYEIVWTSVVYLLLLN